MKKRLSYFLLIIATIIWGLAFTAQKEASVLPVFTVGVIRSIFASLLLFILIPITDSATKSERRLFGGKKKIDFNKSELIGGAILGVILTVATTFQQYGLGDGTDAGKAAFITALYVVIVPIFSALLGKKPSILAVISLPIAIFGFYLLCIKPGSVLEISDLLVLICAIIFAGHIITVDHFSPKCDSIRISFVQFFVSFILNGVLALIFDGTADFHRIGAVLPWLLFLGIGSSGVAYTLQIVGQKNADPTVTSMILSMESVFGVIGSAIFLNERMQIREYIGCAVVFVAVLLAQLDISSFKKLLSKRGDDNE